MNIQNTVGNTALHLALSTDVIQELLKAITININLQNQAGETALLINCRYKGKAVNLLLDRKEIDVNLKDYSGNSPLHAAFQQRGNYFEKTCIPILESLVNHKSLDINAQNGKGESLLHLACRCNQSTIVKLLIDHNIDVNLTNSTGQTALDIVFEELESRGTTKYDPDIIPTLLGIKTIKLTPKILVKSVFYPSILETILHFENLNFNEKDSNGDSMLTKTAEIGNEEKIILLLNCKDIDVNIQNSKGETGLYLACKKSAKSIVKLFLSRNDLDLSIKDSNGATLLEAASHQNDPEILQLLIDKNSKSQEQFPITQSLVIACETDNFEVMKFLLNLYGEKIDFNFQIKSTGNSFLHILCSKSGNEEIISLFLQFKSIDVNLKNLEGNTPLHIATGTNLIETVQILLQHEKIDINLQNNLGKTSLMNAMKGGRKETLIELLCKRKDLDVNLKDTKGMTVLHKGKQFFSFSKNPQKKNSIRTSKCWSSRIIV